MNIHAGRLPDRTKSLSICFLAPVQAEENIGMAMVYTLVDIVREWLLENNLAGQVCLLVFHLCTCLLLW